MAQFLNIVIFVVCVTLGQLSTVCGTSAPANKTVIPVHNATIVCGSLTCPQTTVRCVVQTVTNANQTMLNTTQICFNNTGAIVAQNSNMSKNINPTDSVNLYSETVFGPGAFNMSGANSVIQQMEQYQQTMAELVWNQIHNFFTQPFFNWF